MKKQKKKIVKISIFKNLKRVFVRTIGKEIQENLEVAFWSFCSHAKKDKYL